MLQRLQVSSIGTFCNDKHLCLNFEDLRIITCLSLIARHFPLSITCRKCRFPLTWNPPSAKRYSTLVVTWLLIFHNFDSKNFLPPSQWHRWGRRDLETQAGFSSLDLGHAQHPPICGNVCSFRSPYMCKVITYIICFCMSSPVSLLLYSLQKKPGIPGTATFLKHREESLKSLKLFVFGCLRYLWTVGNHQIICGILRSLFYKIVTRTWPLWWFHIIVIQVDT